MTIYETLIEHEVEARDVVGRRFRMKPMSARILGLRSRKMTLTASTSFQDCSIPTKEDTMSLFTSAYLKVLQPYFMSTLSEVPILVKLAANRRFGDGADRCSP